MASSDAAPASILHRYDSLTRERGRLRQRDAAESLGVSEAELVHARAQRGQATPLQMEENAAGLGRILAGMPQVGRVMILTRNKSCVHEKYGLFEQVSADGPMGMAVGRDIDLRLFFNHWRHGFHVFDETGSGRRESLQFYDAAGDAVHKIYVTSDTDAAAFTALVKQYASAVSDRPFQAAVRKPPPSGRADAEIDVGGLHEAWLGLQHTHDFFMMLKQFGAERRQAFRLVGHVTDSKSGNLRLAELVDAAAVSRLLNGAAKTGAPIMCFTGNPGCIQIHTGPVVNIKTMGPWLNVLDPGFNLHLREDHISEAWVVRKPTQYGTVTSLELYDADGGQICQFFGERKPGASERSDWRALLAEFVLQDNSREKR